MSGWKVHELRLVNFCQYQDRTFRFRPGLNVICGPNRSGKSNLLAGLRICLTGKSGNAGVKRSDIREGSEGASFVELCLDAESSVARIVRGLRGKRTRILFADGQETVNGDAAANQWCEQQGFTSRVVGEILIPAQEDLFSFLLATPAVRTQVFQRLLGLDRLTKKHEWLRDHLSHVQQRKDEVRAQLHTDPEALQSLADKVAGLEKRLAGLPSLEESQLKLQELVAQQAQFQGWQRQLQQLQAQVQQLRQAAVSDEELEQAKQVANQYRELSSKLEPMRKQLEALQQQIQLLRPSVNELSQLRAGLQHPGDPPVAESEEALRDRIASLTNSGKVLETALRFSLQGSGSCPVCDRPMQDDDQWRQAAQDRLETMEREARECAAKLQKLAAWKSAVEEYNRRKARIDQLDAFFAKQGIKDPVLHLRSLEEQYRQAEQNYVELEERFDSLAELVRGVDVDQLVHQAVAARGQLAAATEALQRHLQQQPQPVTDEQLQALRTQVNTIVGLRGELEASRDLLHKLQQDAAQSQQLERRLERLEQWERSAKSLAALLKWDQLPVTVLFSRLRRLCEYVNSWLQSLNAGFHVRLREDLGFDAHTQGVWQPAERLSGGQKVMLAVAFRLAIAFSASPHAFMAMDEPTTYLDAEHLEAFRDLLGNLHNLLLARGKMLLLVTHDEQLITNASQDGYSVIQLP